MKHPKLAMAAALISGLGVVILLGTTVSDLTVGDEHLKPVELTPELVNRGAHLARLGDCAACHSVPGRPPFTGGLAMKIPIGTIYTTNITFDAKEGIGTYSLPDFDRALRFGVSHGHTLYPAMPYPSYSNLKPDDVQALYAYFKYSVNASATPNVPNEVPFPLSLRFPLTMWRWAYAPEPHPFQAPESMDAQLANGAYFVEGLGHCGECHTPRGAGMQVEAQTPEEGADFLAGARVDNWYAPSLRSLNSQGTLGDWSEADLASFLRSGANNNGIAFGSMSDVIEHSTQYMTQADAVDAAKFLKSLDPASTNQSFTYSNTTDHALKNGDASQRGALIYLDNCAACHKPNGQGYDRVFPRLAGNPVIASSDPSSVISIVLAGSKTVWTDQTPAQFQMPSFAWRLSDQDVADVVSFLRSSWGNQASSVDATAVRALRKAAVASDGINEPTSDGTLPGNFLPPAHAANVSTP